MKHLPPLAKPSLRPLRLPPIYMTLPGVSIHIPDPSAPASARMKADAAEHLQKPTLNLAGTNTPLSRKLNSFQAIWLLDYVCDRWLTLHLDLSSWRAKMKKWEKMSLGNYEDRVAAPDRLNLESTPDVFLHQNDTLGMAEGFVDFFTAQARNDIFGTKPWLAATPEGKNDHNLADRVTKHSQWKLGQSNLEQVLRDALRVASWGGTCFVKSRWMTEQETYERSFMAAHSVATGLPILNEKGEAVTDENDAALQLLDGEDVKWKQIEREEITTVFDNSCSSLLDFEDVAFERKAQDLDLYYTDFFSRFRIGLLDAVAAYGLSQEQVADLRLAMVGYDEAAKDHLDESNTTDKTTMGDSDNSNPLISLVEGFVRCDPFGNGKPIRIHVIFSQTLNALFRVDYLPNATAGGMLPVFPIRIHKVPARIFGVGYFEKYENANNAVDRQHNAVTYRNRQSASIYTTFQPDALIDGGKDRDFTVDSTKPFTLAPDKTIDDLVAFKAMPDMNNRSVELLNQQLQMAQMRSGITSAAQGELKGVPNASTATGVNQLQSRGAILLKDPIDQASEDVRKIVEYNVHLLYANQDHDETFTWGEGEDSELLSIQAGDVQGLRANVQLTLVQSQNVQKLQNAQLGIQIAGGYAQLPETEKTSQRRLYIQALSSLGFNDAESIIRHAVTDPAGIMAIMPPDIAPMIEQVLAQAGLINPGSTKNAAPVTPPPMS